MGVDELIIWCNDNQGFLNFVLSVSSIIISVIAIIVSVRATKAPYKYKISLNIAYFRDGGAPSFDISVINYGFGMASVKKIIVMNRECLVCASTNETSYLKSCEEKRYIVKIFDCQGYIEENALDLNDKILVKVYMMDGKVKSFKNGFSVG